MIPNSLEENIIYQTGKLTKRFQDQMQKTFSASGHKITVEQFTILAQLWYQDGLRQQEIAEAIDRDKTTVSRVLNTMIKQGLVTRVQGIDKRERLVHLTNYGRELRDKLVTLSGQLYMGAIADLDEKEIRAALTTIAKILKNLN
jgi:DNA-binding MarR family transcriptional regulator